MQLSTRDIDTISFVARFGQVSFKHIERVIFSTSKSRNSCDVVIQRLLRQKLLVRIEKRTVGGARGGSGQYVYQIGAAGWKLSDAEGAYWQARTVNYHSLAIADTYTQIYEAQGDMMSLVRYETEPDSHVRIAYVPLLPDLYVELRIGTRLRRVWLEVDLGTERPRQLKEKMQRYHEAWSGAGENWNPWPLVVWVVPDEKRRLELESLIAQAPADSRPMYRLSTPRTVAQVVAQ